MKYLPSLLLPIALLVLTSMPSRAQDAGDTENTREIITRYLESDHTDLSMMAEDVVFINRTTGDHHTGPEGVREMLHHVYNVAFDAHAETRNLIVDGNKAVLEAEIVGTHIGEFAGVAATNRSVRIPLVVIYEIEGEKITEGRIYFELPALMAQLNGP